MHWQKEIKIYLQRSMPQNISVRNIGYSVSSNSELDNNYFLDFFDIASDYHLFDDLLADDFIFDDFELDDDLISDMDFGGEDASIVDLTATLTPDTKNMDEEDQGGEIYDSLSV